MKFTLPKDFCLWVVPSNDGKVHKVRFTVWRALSLVLLVVAFLGTFAFISGDYARVRFLRIKNAIVMKNLTTERNKLMARKDELSKEVQNLLDKNRKVLDYEKSIKGRMDEIAAIFESAAEMGLLPDAELKSGSNSKSDADALGGLETDCTEEDCFHPSSTLLSESSDAFSRLHVTTNPISPEQFIGKIDGLVALLKTVPMRLPTTGHMTSKFGMRRSPFTGRHRMHHGIDFSAPYGSKIHATGTGTVKSVKRSGTYGLYVDIDHGRGVVTRYAHLSKALVKSGESVVFGKTLGLSGSSGRSTGPHLHYEIRVNKKPIDPSGVLRLLPRIQKILEDTLA